MKYRKLPVLSDADTSRFWSYVDKKGEADCWNWKAATSVGYGRFKLNGSNYLSHRIAFEISKHKIKHDNAVGIIRHSCDNPACCNPLHLEIGTHKDNSDDMVKRGRGPAYKPRKKAYSKIFIEAVCNHPSATREAAAFFKVSERQIKAIRKDNGCARPRIKAVAQISSIS
jgi:hypothetical protein